MSDTYQIDEDSFQPIDGERVETVEKLIARVNAAD